MNMYLIGSIAGIIILYLLISRRKSTIQNISVEELKALDLSKVTLVDVRTAKEVKGGTIGKPKAIELSANFHKAIQGLNKDADYVVYCRSGRRSKLAADIMARSGFTHVSNLTGGIQAWKAAN
jgi:rhodanese-related sulfurtransferase